jgi:adenylate cyclase
MQKFKFLLPILIFVILQLIFISDYWLNLEHKAQDMLFQIRGKSEVSENVVIVNIGDDTFSSLGIQWPFPREYHAALVENLQRAGAAEIVFDIEFVEKSNALSDSIFAATLAKYHNITLAGKIITQHDARSRKVQILPPLDKFLRGRNSWGTVNISADLDGFVRKYELFQPVNKTNKYSLGAMSVASFVSPKNFQDQFVDGKEYLQIADYLIPKFSHKSALLNYYGPAETFSYYEYADVLDSADFEIPFLDLDLFEEMLAKNIFKDKIVLIGVSAVEFHDSHPTPFFSQTKQLTPGVEIHATFIDNVLLRNHLKHYPYIILLRVFFFTTIILFFININIRPTISILYNSVLLIAYFGVAYFLFRDHNLLLPILEIPAIIIIVYIIGLVFQYIKSIQEKFFIKKAFGQYIAPELVDELLSDPKKLEYGGSLKDISVLYSDIVSFTSYTESHSPKETVDLLREYLTAMVEVIKNNRGTLDKFVGDEIVALFGAPLEMEDHAYWACKAALEMRYRMQELQNKWQKEGKDIFEIGIGINSGLVTVGNLGSEQIFDYTAIGDNMNAGARIEALTRSYKTENNIIISESTNESVSDKFVSEYVDDAMVKGKAKSIKVFQLIREKNV